MDPINQISIATRDVVVKDTNTVTITDKKVRDIDKTIFIAQIDARMANRLALNVKDQALKDSIVNHK